MVPQPLCQTLFSILIIKTIDSENAQMVKRQAPISKEDGAADLISSNQQHHLLSK
jgi:hypothetical protein